MLTLARHNFIQRLVFAHILAQVHRQRLRLGESFLKRKSFNCLLKAMNKNRSESKIHQCWRETWSFCFFSSKTNPLCNKALFDRNFMWSGRGSRLTNQSRLLPHWRITHCRSHFRDLIQDCRNIVTGTANLQWHHPLKTNGYYSKTYGCRPHV